MWLSVQLVGLSFRSMLAGLWLVPSLLVVHVELGSLLSRSAGVAAGWTMLDRMDPVGGTVVVPPTVGCTKGKGALQA